MKGEIFMQKIEDFGEKIGGARKDIYSSRASLLSCIYEMNDAEKTKYIKKEKIWPLGTDKEMIAAGNDPFVVMWIRTVRKMIAPEPRLHYADEKRWSIYSETLLDIKEKVMNTKSEEDIEAFYRFIDNLDEQEKEKWSYVCFIYDLKKIKYYHNSMKRKVMYNELYGNKTRTAKKRKTNFCPPQLEFVNRTGTDYRYGNHVSPEAWQNKFNFRGVEFGNWMTQADRQISMNYCYDALLDMAKIIGIEPEDIAFNGELAIAFGARGMSRALAHYEPVRQVINLTKMRGAGSTAHEWFHALDHHIARIYDVTDGTLASEYGNWTLFPDSLGKLMNACKRNPDGGYTEYYRNSKIFDRAYSKDSHGYWSSNCEMMARAFACYCRDKYDGESDYLYAHSEAAVTEYNGKIIRAVPTGEERKRINQKFDDLFKELISLGILHYKDYSKQEEKNVPEIPDISNNIPDLTEYIMKVGEQYTLKLT